MRGVASFKSRRSLLLMVRYAKTIIHLLANSISYIATTAIALWYCK
ncbi:hypothetical protein [uncultured Nostoc sp.]